MIDKANCVHVIHLTLCSLWKPEPSYPGTVGSFHYVVYLSSWAQNSRSIALAEARGYKVSQLVLSVATSPG